MQLVDILLLFGDQTRFELFWCTLAEHFSNLELLESMIIVIMNNESWWMNNDEYLHEVQTEIIHENLLDQLRIDIVQFTAVNEIVNQTLRMLPNRLVVSKQ